MAECFCGCGRRVGLTSRGINKQGRRTTGLLAKLGERQALIDSLVIDTIGNDGYPTDDTRELWRRSEICQDLIDEGASYEAFWTDAVHGVVPPPQAARQIKREWVDWGRTGMGTVRALGGTVSRFGAFTGRV